MFVKGETGLMVGGLVMRQSSLHLEVRCLTISNTP